MVETFRTSIAPLGADGAERTVRVYLPPGAAASDARHPVLYMLDGQNLFADADATYGRAWRLAEHLDARGPALIVVGLDSAPGERRRDEYTPWPVADAAARGDPYAPRAGGRSHALLDWIAHELKPTIDARYRSDPDATALAGASLGGLMAIYGACAFPHIFRRAAAVSAAVVVNEAELGAYQAGRDLSTVERLYVDVGTQEWPDPVQNADYLRACRGRPAPAARRTPRGVRVSWPMPPLPWEALEPRLRELVDRPLDAAGVAPFLLDVDAVQRDVGEAYATLIRAKDEDTADEGAKAAFLAFVQEVLPRLEPVSDHLNRKLLAVPDYRPPAALARAWADMRDQVELYRDANVPLQAEEATLQQRYGEIAGRTRVEIDGKELTVAAAIALLEEPDRAVRERAYRAIDAAKEANRADLDALYLEFARLRETLARNADHPDYRAYAWRSLHRHEYTPEDALALHEAIAEELVPRLRAQRERRRERLGVASLRPWDLQVDPDGRPPLRPFGDVGELSSGLRRMFHSMDPDLGTDYELLLDGWMDLEARTNKVPGLGYQLYFPVSRRPYVYWSAAGTDDDLVTMRHEAGHAFHSIATERSWPLLLHTSARAEVHELASQAMELLSLPFLVRERGGFYGADDAARSQAMLLDRVFGLLVSVCQVDAIQHWIYDRPAADLTIEGIDAAWLALQQRFDTGVDWSGLERPRTKGWQVIHVFQFPFYYLEYGLAYLGALQLWERALVDPAEALAGYKRMLALGGTRPIDELYAAAGIEFRFDRATIARLADLVVAKMDEDAGGGGG